MNHGRNFHDYLRAKLGSDDWYLARPTLANMKRYGPKAIFLTHGRYDALRIEYLTAQLDKARNMLRVIYDHGMQPQARTCAISMMEWNQTFARLIYQTLKHMED